MYDVDSSIAADFQTSFQQVLQSVRKDLYRNMEFIKAMLETNEDVQWMKDTLARSSEMARSMISCTRVAVKIWMLYTCDRNITVTIFSKFVDSIIL